VKSYFTWCGTAGPFVLKLTPRSSLVNYKDRKIHLVKQQEFSPTRAGLQIVPSHSRAHHNGRLRIRLFSKRRRVHVGLENRAPEAARDNKLLAEVKSLSPTDRFLIAFHSPSATHEPGLVLDESASFIELRHDGSFVHTCGPREVDIMGEYRVRQAFRKQLPPLTIRTSLRVVAVKTPIRNQPKTPLATIGRLVIEREIGNIGHQ
jgi:hypothetical protein